MQSGIPAALALGIVLCSAAMRPAAAETSIDTAAFTLSYTDGPNPEDWSITLVDQDPGHYSFSLDTLNRDLALAEARDLTGAGSFDSKYHYSTLFLDLKPAYRVTGITVTGTAFGELGLGYVPDFPPGQAHNGATFYMTVWKPTGPVGYGHMFDDFQAEQSLAGGETDLDLVTDTILGFSGSLFAQAWGVNGDGAFAESMARASVRDVTLHVTVAAIPEPGTWLMLAAGLGALGLYARRRES
ncbi:putative secreted protein with PEP-CTERM sorting signal [Pseudoduganella lurida]|uniref:Putative secreted protein with PEP-CTERM sorting signal n=1 Tax=Pseudoduganella lurida TaxID=1036180 RepID=A0A562RNB6_9BURK|nr:PEP-CTERM sorting domain-containing protein [Pseudoduganella lurida]TWI69920.1 putative secreted protein with PEP-CTERM sorting signal [Pseudoduganella lurida]